MSSVWYVLCWWLLDAGHGAASAASESLVHCWSFSVQWMHSHSRACTHSHPFVCPDLSGCVLSQLNPLGSCMASV